MSIQVDLAAGEKLLFETGQFNPWWYIGVFMVAMVPPFIIGIALIVVIFRVDKKSGVAITDSRLIRHRQYPWPGKFSHAEMDLALIRHVGRDNLSEFVDTGFLNRIFRLGNIDIEYEKAGELETISLEGIRNPKGFIRALREAQKGVSTESLDAGNGLSD